VRSQWRLKALVFISYEWTVVKLLVNGCGSPTYPMADG